MARPLRIEFPGGLHPLSARGNARASIFLEHSYSQQEIATHSGLRYSTGSRIVQRQKENTNNKTP